MSPLLYQFASGNALFIGVAVLSIGVIASFVLQSVLGRTLIRFFSVIACILVILSAKSLWEWYLYLWFLATAVWLILLSIDSTSGKRSTRICSLVVLAMSLLAMFSQIQFQRGPSSVSGRFERLYVIGDSISSGISEGETLWTDILEEDHSVDVTNYSVAGATLASALPLAMKVPPGDILVLLEIGGNDLLNRVEESKFEKDLDMLLSTVTGSGHTVFMFELPKPPLLTDYGKIQRRLADEYDVKVIPKRYFAKILSGKGNTIDGLHLSDEGHRQMAQVVWKFLGPSLDKGGR